jgi:Flp pilus assembly protein TadG
MSRVTSQRKEPNVHRRQRSERGQSAVEFAVVVPILVLVLVVVSDFGRLFFVSVAVNNAARAGAQYGSQFVTNAKDSTGMVAAANLDGANITGWNTPTASECTCVNPPSPLVACPASYCTHTTTANYVEVDTSATYHTLLTYPGIPSAYTLTGKAVMQVQQ